MLKIKENMKKKMKLGRISIGASIVVDLNNGEMVRW